MCTKLGALPHVCHLAHFAEFDYEVYSVYRGKWIDFDPNRPLRVVPCILPIILRMRQEKDSHCLGLAALVQQCHFIANAAGFPIARIPLEYQTDYELYSHLVAHSGSEEERSD